MTLRLFQLLTIVLFVTLLLVNLIVQSWELRVASAALLIIWLVIAVMQTYYLSRLRRRYSSSQVSST